MKKVFALGLCASLIFCGCGAGDNNAATSSAPTTSTASESAPADANQELILSTFGLSADVSEEDVYGPFEKQFNCDIVTETGTSSERYTKIASDPESTIDVIELSQATTAEGIAAGLFEAIDLSKLSNSADLIASAKSLAESGQGIAYAINSIGIIYNPDAIGFEITSFADLWKPELKGKISIPEITSTFGPAMIYMASDYKGVDVTTDQGEAAFEALTELKPNIVKTYTKSSDLANMFSSGEIAVAIVGDFGVPTIQAAVPAAKYVTPDSTYANFNIISINKNSKHKDLAYDYINYRLSSELQTTTAHSLNEAPTNSKVSLTPEESANMTYGSVATNAKLLDFTFVNANLNTWIDQWNRIINA